MPKRYYCEYCHRSFQDIPKNRKKHLSGFTHLRARKEYYDRISVEEQKKPSATSILYSNLTGEEILAQWLDKHPKLKKKAEEMMQ